MWLRRIQFLARLDATFQDDIDFSTKQLAKFGLESLEFLHPRTKIVVPEDRQEIDVAFRPEVVAQITSRRGPIPRLRTGGRGRRSGPSVR